MSQYTSPVRVLTFSLENLRAVLPTPKVPAEDCSICQAVGRGGSKLVKSETLAYDTIPAAVAHLRYFMELGERVKSSWLEICPLCARLYYHETSYEYLVDGSEDCESYVLVSPDEVLRLPEVSWAGRTGKAELHAHASGLWSIIHDAEKFRQKSKESLNLTVNNIYRHFGDLPQTAMMTKELLNLTMNDGSRHFGDLPQTAIWYDLRDHINKLDGAVITNFVTDNVTEAWIDFTYRGHRFCVNDQYGDYWFFVDDPKCPDDILEGVLTHCKLLLGAGRDE